MAESFLRWIRPPVKDWLIAANAIAAFRGVKGLIDHPKGPLRSEADVTIGVLHVR
jgi:hypothetical protein